MSDFDRPNAGAGNFDATATGICGFDRPVIAANIAAHKKGYKLYG